MNAMVAPYGHNALGIGRETIKPQSRASAECGKIRAGRRQVLSGRRIFCCMRATAICQSLLSWLRQSASSAASIVARALCPSGTSLAKKANSQLASAFGAK